MCITGASTAAVAAAAERPLSVQSTDIYQGAAEVSKAPTPDVNRELRNAGAAVGSFESSSGE
jgi:hypothetical protein